MANRCLLPRFTSGIPTEYTPAIRGGPEQDPPDHQRPCEPWLFVLREEAQKYDVPEPRELGLNGSLQSSRRSRLTSWALRTSCSRTRTRSIRTAGRKDIGAMAQRRSSRLAPDTDSLQGDTAQQLNDFEYVDADGTGDPKGIRCPVGAHIRRVNPRGQPVAGQGLPGGSNNSHRLIRRGVPYGPTYDPENPTMASSAGCSFISSTRTSKTNTSSCCDNGSTTANSPGPSGTTQSRKIHSSAPRIRQRAFSSYHRQMEARRSR